MSPDPRWSQVTHYYFEDCVYYTPLRSDPAYGRMYVRDIHDVGSGKLVDNFYLGQRMPEDFKTRLRSQPSIDAFPSDFDPECYLENNPDVARVMIDPAHHFSVYGRAEGRSYKR